jgi:hypothetical protein
MKSQSPVHNVKTKSLVAAAAMIREEVESDIIPRRSAKK